MLHGSSCREIRIPVVFTLSKVDSDKCVSAQGSRFMQPVHSVHNRLSLPNLLTLFSPTDGIPDRCDSSFPNSFVNHIEPHNSHFPNPRQLLILGSFQTCLALTEDSAD